MLLSDFLKQVHNIRMLQKSKLVKDTNKWDCARGKKRLEGTESELERGHLITVPEAEDKLEDHITTVQPVLRLETVPRNGVNKNITADPTLLPHTYIHEYIQCRSFRMLQGIKQLTRGKRS